MNKLQIIYPIKETEIHPYFREEANAMRKQGFVIRTQIENDLDGLLFRGFTIKSKDQYPNHNLLIQGWEQNKKTLFMEFFFPIIQKKSFPTIFINDLDENIVENISFQQKWDKVFIKSSFLSLFAISDVESVWPTTSIKKMNQYYNKWKIEGPFAIRKFIDDPEIFYNEQRYWILNGNAYHPSGEIPDFVKEYGKKMYEFSGSHYFTMDVAGDYIVEINPGESSDRGGDNPLDWFCEIFAKEFLHK